MAYDAKINRLQSKYAGSLSEKLPVEFVSHASDPIAIKKAKELANIILHNKTIKARSWRINYSEFFERFVQYIFTEVSKSSASKAISNPHYSVIGSRPIWAVHYLEPDLIIQKDDSQFVIDAKYKSHMFNWNNISDDLKDAFRSDLHQLLAYCSFNSLTTKKAFLVYPFSEIKYHTLHVCSPLTSSTADIYLVGIPLLKCKLEEIKALLNELVSFKEN